MGSIFIYIYIYIHVSLVDNDEHRKDRYGAREHIRQAPRRIRVPCGIRGVEKKKINKKSCDGRQLQARFCCMTLLSYLSEANCTGALSESYRVGILYRVIRQNEIRKENEQRTRVIIMIMIIRLQKKKKFKIKYRWELVRTMPKTWQFFALGDENSEAPHGRVIRLLRKKKIGSCMQAMLLEGRKKRERVAQFVKKKRRIRGYW